MRLEIELPCPEMEKMNLRIRIVEYLEKRWFDSIDSSLIGEHLENLKFWYSHMFTSSYGYIGFYLCGGASLMLRPGFVASTVSRWFVGDPLYQRVTWVLKGKKAYFVELFLNIVTELFYLNFWYMKEQHFNKIS